MMQDEEVPVDHELVRQHTLLCGRKPFKIDEGFMAWLQVACSFSVYANTFGIVNSFGD